RSLSLHASDTSPEHSVFLPCTLAHRHLHSFPTRRSSDLCRRRRARCGDGRHRWPSSRTCVHRRGRGRSAPARRGSATGGPCPPRDRKSTRLNSSHEWISYAVFCLKKKKKLQKTRKYTRCI